MLDISADSLPRFYTDDMDAESFHSFYLHLLNHSPELHSLIVPGVSFHPLLLAMVAMIFVVEQETL